MRPEHAIMCTGCIFHHLFMNHSHWSKQSLLIVYVNYVGSDGTAFGSWLWGQEHGDEVSRIGVRYKL